jgi:hypothetical protein
LAECSVDDAWEPLLVEAFGDVGYCPTPIGVVAGLGGDDIAQDAVTRSHGSAGVVETSFDREEDRSL